MILSRPLMKRCRGVPDGPVIGEGCDSCLETAPGRVVRQRGSHLIPPTVRMGRHIEMPHRFRCGREVGVGPFHVKVKERDRGEREVVSPGTLVRLF